MAVFRFIYAKITIWMGHEANVSTAPASTMDADEEILFDKDVLISIHDAAEFVADENANPKNDMLLNANEAEEIIANRAVIPFVISRLRAYIRAPLVYIKGIVVDSTAKMKAASGAAMRFTKASFVNSTAKFVSAMGANLRHMKEMKAVRKAKLLNADSATAKAEVGLTTKASALWWFVKAICVKYEEEFVVGKTADAIAAPLEMVLIDEAAYDSIDAPLLNSEAYEIRNSAKIGLEVGSPLCKGNSASATHRKGHVVSVYARFDAYVRSPVVHLKKIITAHFAGAVNADAAEATSRKAEYMSSFADPSKADAAIAKSKANIIKSGVDATAYFAPAEDDFASDKISVADSVAMAETAPAGTAFADESCEPEKAFSFGQAPAEDANAEAETDAAYSVKIVCYFEPYVVNGYLVIPQVFSGVQNYDCLEIDCETESAYWANPIVDGETLTLAFAYEAAQDNFDLGVL